MSAITPFAFRNKIGFYSEPDNFLSNEVTQRWLSEVGLAKKENSTRHVMNCSARIRKDSSYLGHLGVGDARFGGLLGENVEWFVRNTASFLQFVHDVLHQEVRGTAATAAGCSHRGNLKCFGHVDMTTRHSCQSSIKTTKNKGVFPSIRYHLLFSQVDETAYLRQDLLQFTKHYLVVRPRRIKHGA